MKFNFKPLKKSDLPQLFQWLSLPHVVAWWREQKDWNVFEKKYGHYIEIDEVGPFFIFHEQKPIGYISWNETASDPIRTESYPQGTYGFDMFIADLDYVGKGYGPQIIKQFIKEILVPKNAVKVIIDPEIINTRAIRAYEKAGFKKTKIVQATDGTQQVAAQLMELDLV